MKPDPKGLQSWYRDAMLGRIDELVDLRGPVASGSPQAADDLRRVGQALRGSGGTFGFPELSAAAGLVEATPDGAALRRLEGLLVELRRLVGDRRGEDGRLYEWVALGAGVRADVVADASGIREAWEATRKAAEMGDSELAEALAERFGLSTAELLEPGRPAWRLVPEAFMAAEGVVPVMEDSDTITVATADPVALSVELELQRLTGRRPVFTIASPSAIEAVLERASGAVARSPAPDSSSPADTAPADTAPSDAPPQPTQAQGREAERSPREDEAKTVQERRGARIAPEGPVEVLVVDDEAAARLLVRSLLEKRGFRAVEAVDGVEALEKMRSHEGIGLAVVDLNMPRMDGLELMWEIRDAARWADLPVIVVTGEKDEILETQIMEEGADDYVRKPVDPRLFVARVEATLRRAGHEATS